MQNAPSTHYQLLALLGAPQRDPVREDAWLEFVRLYEPAIIGFVKRLGLQHSDALEISQEVLFQVRQASMKSSLPSQDFRAWLACVTRNKVIDLMRKNSRYAGLLSTYASVKTSEQEDASFDALEWNWAQEVKQRLFAMASHQIQQEVSETQWLAFWLTAVEKQSASDVAKRLNISTGNVYVTKCRIMEKLRTLVSQISFEGLELPTKRNISRTDEIQSINSGDGATHGNS